MKSKLERRGQKRDFFFFCQTTHRPHEAYMIHSVEGILFRRVKPVASVSFHFAKLVITMCHSYRRQSALRSQRLVCLRFEKGVVCSQSLTLLRAYGVQHILSLLGMILAAGVPLNMTYCLIPTYNRTILLRQVHDGT